MLRGTCRRVSTVQRRMTRSFGLFAKRGRPGQPGDASVIYHSGTIDVQGSIFQRHLRGSTDGAGRPKLPPCPAPRSSSAATHPGETPVLTAAIAAELDGTAAAGRAITVNAASTINMLGSATPNSSITSDPVGIRALSRANDSAPIFVNYTGPGITTEGGRASASLLLPATAAAVPASTAAASR